MDKKNDHSTSTEMLSDQTDPHLEQVRNNAPQQISEKSYNAYVRGKPGESAYYPAEAGSEESRVEESEDTEEMIFEEAGAEPDEIPDREDSENSKDSREAGAEPDEVPDQEDSENAKESWEAGAEPDEVPDEEDRDNAKESLEAGVEPDDDL